MNTAALYLVGTPVLVHAWVNGANDVSKGVATLVGDGLCDARRAIRWGTLFTRCSVGSQASCGVARSRFSARDCSRGSWRCPWPPCSRRSRHFLFSDFINEDLIHARHASSTRSQ